MNTQPIFDVETTSINFSGVRVVQMSFLHMSHRYGPVTTARLLAGDTVERFRRDSVRIVGMTLQPKPNDMETAL